jgi:hypothetical protein
MMGSEGDREGHGLIGLLENNRSASDIHGLDTLRIVELFKGFGYDCKPSGTMRGISGVLHEFDFVCTNHLTGEKLILQSLLHLNEEEKLDVEVVKLRLSTYDCSPEACLVVSNPMSERVKQLATLYKLVVVDGSSGESPYDQIESLLRLQA